jgi:Ser/Thr protein kinase RdoA (MazF antagonist)
MGVQPAPTPEAEAAVARVWPHYALPAPAVCGPTQVGLNDHHLVTTAEGQYVLRVYRRGWRTADDIAYELAVLLHLAARGVSVCAPIAGRDGAYQYPIQGAEGPRTAVVFPCAPGDRPDVADLDVVRTCGRVMALIHHHTDGFTCEHRRFVLDLDHLLDQPRARLLPYLARRPADAAFVEATARGLRAGLEARIDRLEWGFCHGDFHGGNARVDGEGTVRVFDFDCGGPGWRAYDLAVCRLYCAEDAQWDAFCQGYQEVRPLPAATREAIRWFIVVRQLWRMTLFAENWSRLTGSAVNDEFLDEHVGILRARFARYLPEVGGL